MLTLVKTQLKKLWSRVMSDNFTEDKAARDRQTTTLSPSGRYTLTITPYATKPGCWNYSRGVVTRTDTGEIIADVKRNYSAFPFSFIEDHPNGHPYLVCGEDYQGQTVVELDTGRRKDVLSTGAEKGHGFCWAASRFDAASQMLVVGGCYWACPYEYKFFDFADPISGWPEIKVDHAVDEDPRWPAFNQDGTITCFQTEPESDDDDDDDDEPKKERPVAATQTFRREGLKLVRTEEWVSEAEKTRRAEAEAASRRYEEWKKTFRSSDPLYQTYSLRLKDKDLTPEDYESIGTTHTHWCPHFTGTERRWCRRIVKGSKPYTIDLEWAVETGPVKLTVYEGDSHESRFFEHSEEGMNAAFDYAVRLVRGAA